MRCDSNPEGCANCRAASETCLQVDRVTKKRYARGEFERMQQQNEYLLLQLRALKTQMSLVLDENKRLKNDFRQVDPCSSATSIPSNNSRRTQSLGFPGSMRSNAAGLSESGFWPTSAMGNIGNDVESHHQDNQQLPLHHPQPRSYPPHFFFSLNTLL